MEIESSEQMVEVPFMMGFSGLGLIIFIDNSSVEEQPIASVTSIE